MWSSLKNSSLKIDPEDVSLISVHALEEQTVTIQTIHVVENTNISNNTEPIAMKKRLFTDRYFLILQGISIACLVPLITYCINYGALERLTQGYDSCRNICGQQNVMRDELKKSWCDGLDMTYRPYLLVFRPDRRNYYNATRLNQRHNDVVVPIVLRDNVQRVCLVNCSVYQHYYQYKSRCILEKTRTVADIFWGKSGLPNFFLEVAEDVASCWQELLYLLGVSLILSITVTISFRFRIRFTIWLVLIGLSLACMLGTMYTWVMWMHWTKIINRSGYLVAELELRRSGTYLAFASIGSILSICTIVIIVTMRSRIEFAVRLFKETWKPIAAMPLLLFQPFVTVGFIGAVTATWVYLFLWIESSGHDIELYDDFYEFQKDPWMYFTRAYNPFVALWLMQFLIGCQHMVVAGAVCVWYFANNRKILGTPIFYGFYNLVKYHLGSVSCGSLAIPVTQVINSCFSALQWFLKNRNGVFMNYIRRVCFCSLFSFEYYLKILTRSAYIEIAIYGDPFYQAGKTAYHSLTTNIPSVENVDKIGNCVLFLAKALITIVTILVGIALLQEKEDVQHAWVLITFSGCIAYLVSHCFLAVYEMAMDTVFLCFCEDSAHNDGVSKPYFMTNDLLKFVINSKMSHNALDVEYVHQD